MVTLLDLVDQLTLSQRHRVVQDINGRPRVFHSIELPLLVQLEDAIRGSMERNTGGGSDPATRNVLDSDALFRFLMIKQMINNWLIVAKLPPGKDPAASLRHWYTWTLSAPSFIPDWYERVLSEWVIGIRALLDPAHQMDLPDACPECSATSWTDPEGERFLRPLLITYRADHPLGTLGGATVRCRACLSEWRGLNAVRGVAWQLEQNREIS